MSNKDTPLILCEGCAQLKLRNYQIARLPGGSFLCLECLAKLGCDYDPEALRAEAQLALDLQHTTEHEAQLALDLQHTTEH